MKDEQILYDVNKSNDLTLKYYQRVDASMSRFLLAQKTFAIKNKFIWKKKLKLKDILASGVPFNFILYFFVQF